MKIISVVGARPNFIKIAPIIRAIEESNKRLRTSDVGLGTLHHLLVHTGQHYDYEMSKVFFEDLELPEPDICLGIGSGTHAEQTGRTMIEFERVLLREKPDSVIVVGDVNSTLACALAAVKLHIPVAHVEAGLRSYDRRMPEEINRVLTDHISTFLFCPAETPLRNLQKEGFTNVINDGKLINYNSPLFTDHTSPITDPPSQMTNYTPLVVNVGDVMYESALYNLKIAKKKSKILQTLNLKSKSYILATVHRAENTDYPERLRDIFDSFVELSERGERLIIPLHPRTEKVLNQISINSVNCLFTNSLKLIKPVSYLDMLILESNAKLIMTDSGGVQKEAYFFKVPCVTLRDETEWVETVESGWNRLAGRKKGQILESVKKQFLNRSRNQKLLYGDGKTAERIVKILFSWGKRNIKRRYKLNNS